MRTRPAAYSVIIEQGQILLSHFVATIEGRQISGWTLPGGGIEAGEQPEQTAVREAYEETGYRVRVDHLLGVHCAYAEQADGSLFCAMRTLYRSHIVGGQLTVEQDGSTDDVRWVPIAELPALIEATKNPGTMPFFDEIAAYVGYRDLADWAAQTRRVQQETPQGQGSKHD